MFFCSVVDADGFLKLSKNLLTLILSYRPRIAKVQHPRLSTTAGTVCTNLGCPSSSYLINVPGSRKPSRKFGQHNACAAIVVSLSVRQKTRASKIKPSSSEHTIHQRPVQDPLDIRIWDLNGEDNVLLLHTNYFIFIMICNAPVNLSLPLSPADHGYEFGGQALP